MLYTGCPKKNATLSLRICRFRKCAAIFKPPGGISARGLDVMFAKDGRYILINKKVMAISVWHDFYGRIYEYH